MLISEFLPNPAGKDAESEWIKLFNNGDEAVNLSGWRIKDASGKVFIFGNYKVSGGEYLILDYKTTKIPLNNNGETLFLYDKNGQLVDKAEYVGSAPEGKSLTRKGDEFVFAGQSAPSEKSINQNAITNYSITVDHSGRPAISGANHLLIGLGIALFLAFASVLIIKKLNFFDEF